MESGGILSRAALPQIEQHRGILWPPPSGPCPSSGLSEDAITRMCEAYYEAEQRMKDTVWAALTGEWADPSGDDAEVYAQACTAVYADARAEAAAAIGQGAAAILIASVRMPTQVYAPWRWPILPGLSEADRAELLGSSYTASFIEPAGQTTEKMAPPPPPDSRHPPGISRLHFPRLSFFCRPGLPEQERQETACCCRHCGDVSGLPRPGAHDAICRDDHRLEGARHGRFFYDVTHDATCVMNLFAPPKNPKLNPGDRLDRESVSATYDPVSRYDPATTATTGWAPGLRRMQAVLTGGPASYFAFDFFSFLLNP